MWKSRTGTNQNMHPAVSTCKMATGKLEQFSSARLKETDFHKHTGKSLWKSTIPCWGKGGRQALVLEILKHVFKHMRTAVDFGLCSPGLGLLMCTKLPREGMLQQSAGYSSVAEGVRCHHC